jgi:carboxyl-terminal processing protease
LRSALRSGFTQGLLAGIVLAIAAGALYLQLTGSSVEKNGGGLVPEARSVIDENYYKPVTQKELDEASVAGMVAELKKTHKDRFSHYFTPQDLATFNESTSGSVNGIGLTVSEIKQGLRIASVLDNTPAKRAGLKRGDVITEVDGKSIAGKSADVAAGLIKGEPGTKVELHVEPVDGKPYDISVERAAVRVPAVDGRIRKTPDGERIAYVAFATFSSGAHAELRETIERLYRRGAQGLVLDMRGNGGGLLNEAILCASIFVDHGKVVSTESRTQGDKTYDAVGDPIENKPTVVLINRDTASAAEILSAAMQYYDVADLVGTRSFGKGVFQEVIHLEAGGALDLTIGQYFTAAGVSLTGKGVKPDVLAPDDPTAKGDETYDAGVKRLESEIPHHSAAGL